MKKFNINKGAADEENDDDDDKDEEENKEEPDDILEERSKFDLEVVRLDGKKYLTFKRKRGSF